LDGLVLDVAAEDSVVGCADDFGEEEDLEFVADAEDFAGEAEGGEAPVTLDFFAAETLDGAAEEAGVFAFFSEPMIDDALEFGADGGKGMGVVGDEGGRTASVAEFELFERAENFVEGSAF
jgi:hypothetical protein